jgi:hypothetical protein
MPQQQPPTTSGPVDAVRCPHCGRGNDLRDLDSQNLLDTGNDITCEPHEGLANTGHCGRVFTVVAIRMVKLVVVRASTAQATRQVQAAPAARTVGPGIIRRLLGNGK